MLAGAVPAPSCGGPDLIRLYEGYILFYLISLLYLYPYGVAVSADANLRAPDIVALFALLLGSGAILLRGRIRVDRVLLAVTGMFLLLELVSPFVGALGYRRPVDAVSGLRMAMLWLPMVFLTLLAAPRAALRFEERLALVLAASLWLNVAYGVLQIAADLGYLPRSLLVTVWLEPWAVDQNYSIVQGLRPAGFFANSTALSVFGVACLCFFYARYVSTRLRRDLVHTLLSIVIVVLTTSRTAYAATAVILLAGWLRLPVRRKAVVTAIVAAGASAMLLLIQKTVGLEQAFHRFQRLAESGILEDVSFGARLYRIWPTALEAARDYTFGTLIQAPRALPLIDSGYLTYYLQGKWVFVAALVVLVGGQWLVGLQALLGSAAQRIGVMTLFLAIYLTVALVISNPLRSPLMIFFIVYALWRLAAEREGQLVRHASAAAAAEVEDRTSSMPGR